MKRYFIPLLIVLPFVIGLSQEIVPISENDLEQKVLDNNLQVKMAQNEAQLAETELLGTRAMYLPNVNASYTFSNTNNPLYAFGSKLNQERISAMDFDPASLNDPKAISNFATKLEVQQPIINMDAVYQKKLDKLRWMF